MKITVAGNKCSIFDIFPNERVWLLEHFTFSNEYSIAPEESIWEDRNVQGYYAAAGMASIIKEKAGDSSEIVVDVYDPEKRLQVDFDEEIIKHVHKNIFEEIELRDYQVTAVKKGVSMKEGLIESPTGSGKTEIIFAILKVLFDNGRIKRALLIAPDIYLSKQLCERALIRGFNKGDVGLIQGDNRDATRMITVATIDSLTNRYHSGSKDVIDLIETVEFVVWDECHHLQSQSNRDMLFIIKNAKYIIGLSASPFTANSPEGISDLVLLSLVKRVIFKLDQRYLTDKGYIARPIVHFKYIGGQLKNKGLPYNKLYKNFIVNHRTRNNMIVKFALLFKKYKLPCLILVTQKEHGLSLLRSISQPDCVAMFGGSEQLKFEEGVVVSHTCDYQIFKGLFECGNINTVIATQVFDEGVDLPHIGAYINAAAGRSHKKTTQRLGRSLRKKKGFNETYVIDFCDRTHPIFYNQYKDRRIIYEDKGAHTIDDEYEFLRRIHQNYMALADGK